MQKLIETKDLETNFYTYEGVVKALNKISLMIPRGCTFGLVGESGCGKSVTARSIMRIVQPPGRIESGEIFLFLDQGTLAEAVDLLAQSEVYMQQLRGNQISMIFQEPNAALNPIMSIGEQVVESYLLHQYDDLYREAFGERVKRRWGLLRRWRLRAVKKVAEARAVDLLGQLGIANPGEVIGRYPHNLSGGMKQRIVIAMALACDPVLLIADEATSNLDVTIQAQILELLRNLKQERISSILLITHDLGVVAEICNRVGVMYAGNLCEEADVDGLFRYPRHPYSRALLASVPGASHTKTLQSIDGAVPNLVNPPPGCRFHPRCPSAMGICAQVLPATREIAAGHTVACHLYTQTTRPEHA